MSVLYIFSRISVAQLDFYQFKNWGIRGFSELFETYLIECPRRLWNVPIGKNAMIHALHSVLPSNDSFEL